MRRAILSTAAAALPMLKGDDAPDVLLTDVVLGTWTSANLLDLCGGTGSSAAAQRLIGAGLLAVGPTAWTGWAEWSAAAVPEGAVSALCKGSPRRSAILAASGSGWS